MYQQLMRRVRAGIWVVAAGLAWVPRVAAEEKTAAQARTAITRAVAFLSHAQQPDGSFAVSICRDRTLTTGCTPDPATQPVGIVLRGLSSVTTPDKNTLLSKAAQFLKTQMNGEGLFQYHTRSHVLAAVEPATLEDTCVNRAALEQAGDSLPSVVPQLAAYRTIGGTFYPFAYPVQEANLLKSNGEARKRFTERYRPDLAYLVDVVDPVVNANIFSYLAMQTGGDDALCRYLVNVSSSGSSNGSSVFYESPNIFAQAFSRAYVQGAACLEPGVPNLRASLLARQQPDGSWGNSLETAWALSALSNLGARRDALDRAVRFLLNQQNSDGSWKQEAWWSLVTSGYWFGSPDVTTGFVLEALGGYLTARH